MQHYIFISLLFLFFFALPQYARLKTSSTTLPQGPPFATIVLEISFFFWFLRLTVGQTSNF
jgi:hypothetical protein